MNLPNQLPTEERPRERLIRHGPFVLTTPELLAIILRTGHQKCNVIHMSRLLLKQFGSLRNLLGATLTELTQIQGLGTAKACQLKAILELARRTIEEDLFHTNVLDHPDRVKQYCLTTLGHYKVEYCIALYLDNQLKLISCQELARGTLSQASVYPREVVRDALSYHAAALIIAHNHPSGQPQASGADHLLTRHLKQALALVDIRLIDHIIVAGNEVMSLAELGQI